MPPPARRPSVPRRAATAVCVAAALPTRAGRWPRRLRCLQHEERRRDVGDPLPAILDEAPSAAACGPAAARRTGAPPSSVRARHRAEHVRHVLAVERRAGPSASRTARSRTPRCRCACPTGSPRRLLGTHIRGRAEDHAHAGHHRGRGDRRRPATSLGRHRGRRAPSPSRGRSRAPSPCRPAAP